jgi:hypothetical protein
LDIARQGYTDQQILDILFAKKGSRKVKFRYDLLDKNNQKITELKSVISGEVSFNSLAEIKRTAKFVLKEDEKIDWLNDRIQPFVLFKMPDGNWAEFSMGIFMLSSPKRVYENNTITRRIDAYDLSLILKQDKFTDRYSIGRGAKYYDAIIKILASAGINISDINIQQTNKVLDRDLEFEIGTEKKTAINQLLNEINYTSLFVDENGIFTSYQYVSPSDRESEITYQDDQYSVLYPNIEEELDLFDVANVFSVVVTNPDTVPLTYTYENDNPNSITSTVNRNRKIVDYREIDNISDLNTLENYVKRIAFEASQIYTHLIFNTAIMPIHGYSNILNLKDTKMDINDKYSETSWRMYLETGGKMEHTVRKVVSV